MLKTLNDFLSLIALLIITFLSLRIFIGSLFNKERTNESRISRFKFLKDYINNEED